MCSLTSSVRGEYREDILALEHENEGLLGEILGGGKREDVKGVDR